MAPTIPAKEEFYIRRLFDDDVPVFVDATRYVRQELPYPLSAKRSLKSTCGVRTDDEVVAFSLRNYTGKQAEKEVENVESATAGKVTSQNLLRLRMPRKTLHDLNDRARALSVMLGDEVIVELDERLYVLSLSHDGGEAELVLAGTLAESDSGYVRSEPAEEETEFELPITGVRLRVFLRSPIRDRVLAYAFSGYLTRKPGEVETVTRATALALNGILGLATFRMLSGLEHVQVPPLPANVALRPRPAAERLTFPVPVMLYTTEGAPAARGHVTAEIDLEHIDPQTGGLQLYVTEGEHLEWNPALDGAAPPFEAYERVLVETAGAVIHSILGADAVRDVAYDIMLADLQPEVTAGLRTAIADLPLVAARPDAAEVRPSEPTPAVPAAQPA